jgi:hypothetical protein
MPTGQSDLGEIKEVKTLAVSQGSSSSSTVPSRQLQDLPHDELKALAEEYGLDVSAYRSPQHLVAALHERRQLISMLDREALLDIIKWSRRPVPLNAGKEQLAQEIARITSMRFTGLPLRGLAALARLRGLAVTDEDNERTIVRRLKKQEGFFAKLNRKRRRWIGGIVSNILGEEGVDSDYKFLPPQPGQEASSNIGSNTKHATLKEEIEEVGLFGGIAGRIKKSADSYLNQKLDEIESRIDRKLDEIDRRLAEWRDKEIANRIRILKITLWASVIVASVSLLYSYIVYIAGILR